MEHQLHHFEQVRDVLDFGIELHGRLHNYYQTLEQQSRQDRVKMVLDYLSRHESQRQSALQRFENSPQHQRLDVWLQFAPSTRIDEMLKSRTIRSDATVDDVVRIALDFDNALIEIYQEAAREAGETSAQDVFRCLVQEEEHERQRFIRDCGWFSDF